MEKHKLKHLLIEGKQAPAASGGREGRKKYGKKNERIFASHCLCNCASDDVWVHSYLGYFSSHPNFIFKTWLVLQGLYSSSVSVKDSCTNSLPWKDGRFGRGLRWLNR